MSRLRQLTAGSAISLIDWRLGNLALHLTIRGSARVCLGFILPVQVAQGIRLPRENWSRKTTTIFGEGAEGSFNLDLIRNVGH